MLLNFDRLKKGEAIKARRLTDAELTQELIRLSSENDCKAMLDLLNSTTKATAIPMMHHHVTLLLDTCLRLKAVDVTFNFIMGHGAASHNPIIIRQALQIFSCAGASDKVLDMIELLSALGETVSKNDYDLLLNSYAQSGDTDALLKTKDKMSQTGFLGMRWFRVVRGHFNLALKSCVTNNDHFRAIKLFEEMKSSGIFPDRYTWGTMIHSYVNNGDIAGGEVLLENMISSHRKYLSAHAFNHILHAYALRKDANAVYERFERFMKLCKMSPTRDKISLAPDKYTFGICLRVASDACDKRRIVELIELMTDYGAEISYATWRVVTVPYMKTSDGDGLKYLIDIIVAKGVVTNFVVWRDLIGIYGKCGRPQDAYGVMMEMKKRHGIQPNEACYGRVVRAFSGSLALVRQNKDVHVDVDVKAAQATAYFDAVLDKEDRDLGGEINIDTSNLKEFSGYMRSDSLADELPAFGSEGKLKKINENKVDEMSHPSQEPNLELIFNWAKGRDVIREMRADGLKPHSGIWRYVILGCAQSTPSKSSGPGSTSSNLLEILNEMYSCDGIFPRTDTWTTIVSSIDFGDMTMVSSSGDIALPQGSDNNEENLFFRLINSFPSAEQERFLVDAITTLCDELVNSKEKAYFILSNLKPYKPSQLMAWRVLMQAYSTSGNSRDCYQIMTEFENHSCEAAPVVLWLKLIDSFAFIEKQFRKSFEIADSLIARYENSLHINDEVAPDRAMLVPFFNRMLEISVLADHPRNFTRYFDTMTHFQLAPDLDTYAIVSKQYISHNQTDLFNDCVDEMIKLIIDGAGVSDFKPIGNEVSVPKYVDTIGEMNDDDDANYKSTALKIKDANNISDVHELLKLEKRRRNIVVGHYFSGIIDVLMEREYWGLVEDTISRLKTELMINCELLSSKYVSKMASYGNIEDAVVLVERAITGDDSVLLKDMALWHEILHQARQHYKPEEARFAIEKMLYTLNINPDVYCWNMLISTYGDVGRLDEAAAALKEMMRFCEDKLDPSTWDILFEQFNKKGDPKGCLNLLRMMYRTSREINTPKLSETAQQKSKKKSLFGGLLKELFFGDEFDDSRSSAFKDAGLSVTDSPSNAAKLKGVTPTMNHWFLTVDAFVKSRGGEAGLKELRRMREEFKLAPSIKCYTCVLHEFIENDQPELIGKVLRYMNEDKVILQRNTLEKMKEMRRFDMVLEVIEQINSENEKKAELEKRMNEGDFND